MEQCPVCHHYSVVYEEYFKTFTCLMTNCGWQNRFKPIKEFTEREKNGLK